MKNILVATDLSARSDRAVSRAAKLAKTFQAKLTVIHVIDSQIPNSIIEDAKKSAQREIEACLKSKSEGVNVEIKICVGNSHSEILKAIHKDDVDLVVVGVHRHTDGNQPLLGNVIERLMRISHKPILVVKDRSEDNYDKILAALDFKAYSKESLATAFKLFKDSEFHLMHNYDAPFLESLGQEGLEIERKIANDSAEDLRETISKLLKDSKENRAFEINQILKKGYIVDSLYEEAESLNPQLLVLGAHARSGFSSSILPNPTNRILLNPPCDVFLVMS